MSDDELGRNLVPFCNTEKFYGSLLQHFGMGFLYSVLFQEKV